MFFSFDSFPTVGIFIPPCSLRIVNNIEILFDYAFVNYFIDLIQLFGYNFSYFTRITISHSSDFMRDFTRRKVLEMLMKLKRHSMVICWVRGEWEFSTKWITTCGLCFSASSTLSSGKIFFSLLRWNYRNVFERLFKGTCANVSGQHFFTYTLGVPTSARSAFFLNIVQKLCCKFCMILKAFWQHKIDIKRLFKGRNVSIWG